MESTKAWGIKRTLFCLAIAWSNFFWAWIVGPVLGLVIAGLIVALFLANVVVVIPGKCAVCETRKVPRLPFSRTPWDHRNWWNMTPRRRSTIIWVCVDHYDDFVLAHVVMESQRRKGFEHNS
jgi:hypothetical protein